MPVWWHAPVIEFMSDPKSIEPVEHTPTLIADTRSSSEQQLLFGLPRLLLPLLIGTVIAFSILTIQRERQGERQALSDGVRLAEQNFRTHLTNGVELLTTVGQEFAVRDYSRAQFQVRSRQSLRNTPMLVALTWYWTDGTVQGDYALVADPVHAQRIASSEMKVLLTRTNASGRATYSETYGGNDQDLKFDIAVPIAAGQEFSGFVVGTVSINNMMQSLVPSWYSEKYRLDILDRNGEVVVSNSSALPEGSHASFSVPFDPPGQGMTLRAMSFARNNQQPLLYAMVIALALMTGAIAWSVSSLRRYVRERNRAQQQLKASLAFQKAMEESLTVGMRARDLQGRILYVNSAFCKMTGFDREELVGTLPPHVYWSPELTEESFAAFNRVIAGDIEKNGSEFQFRRKNGESFTALVYEAPLVDAEGKHFGWMGSVIDVTERKRAEETARVQQEQLQHTARVVTVGELASSLAHELNQPLAIINSYATGGVNRLKTRSDSADLLPAFERIAEQATRAGKIINWVHEFVKRRNPERAECDLNVIVERAVMMLASSSTKSNVRIHRVLHSNLPRVMGDRVMLEQVLVNLVRNAIEAVGDVDADRRDITITTRPLDTQVMLTVEDTGPGVAADLQHRLFEPFSSTKDKGMGMGLNVSKSIVEQHIGRLWFEPNPVGGARFCVSLPVQGRGQHP
jgi:two-component system, LuxR family, sensor histidine kinase DctS